MNDPWIYEGVRADRHLNNIEVNIVEIEKICKEIDIHKSSSLNNISSRVLKDAFLCQITQFKYLIDQIFKTCLYPDSWKIAMIIPRQKDGNQHSVNNLRPISLLPLPLKNS